MNTGGLQKMSLADYPGQISAIVFTRGCNLKCPYCYNLDENNYEIREEEILEFLEERKGRLDAVVVTGGEPTLQSSLSDFLRKVKEKEYLIKLDTNGTDPDTIKDLHRKDLFDYIAIDLKAPWEKYDRVSGVKVDKEKLHASFRYVIDNGIPHEFRSTMVPSLLSKEDIPEMGEIIKGADRWYLQKFMSNVDMVDNSLKNRSPFTDREMEEMCEIGGRYVSECDHR